MTTKRLMKDARTLRDELAANGPTSRLLVRRLMLDQSIELYRLKKLYDKVKVACPAFIEYLHQAEPLTEQDLNHLAAAEVDRKGLAKIMRGWRARRATEVTP